MGMGMAYIHLGMYSKAAASLQEARNRQTGRNENLEPVLNWLKTKQGDMPGMAIH